MDDFHLYGCRYERHAVVGNLSDTFGPRKVFVNSLILFTSFRGLRPRPQHLQLGGV